MINKIVARNKGHLEQLIDEETDKNGFECDLNHIDVSQVTNMRGIFYMSNFRGNISKWDVSNVSDMSYMFCESQFDGDISDWSVSKVEDMNYMFYGSNFVGDLSKWKPYNLEAEIRNFSKENIFMPYWAKYDDPGARNKAIDTYWLEKELQQELDEKNNGKQSKVKL
jgi:surface protein